MDQVQAEFEAWFSARHPTSDMRRAPGNDSSYINSCVDWAWQGFQGGRMHGVLSHTPDCAQQSLVAALAEALEECLGAMETQRQSGDAGFWDWDEDSEFRRAERVLERVPKC